MSLTNAWTGGQYSLFRAVLGVYLLVHFVHLAPWAAELFSNEGVIPVAADSPLLYLFPNVLALFDGPSFVTALVIVAAIAAVLFAVGYNDRIAALVLWYLWACLVGRNPLITNPGMPYIGWILLAHACIGGAPYGSWKARDRLDPGGGWRMPAGIFTVAWVLMALGYSYSGYTKLISPSWIDGTAVARVLEIPQARPTALREAVAGLPATILTFGTWAALGFELLFAPLALVRRLRPFVWVAMLLMHATLMVLIDFVDLSLGMVMLLLFTFDPAWIKPMNKEATEPIFYDGHCGLCHRWVRFVLAEDTLGAAFRFAPLGGERFLQIVPEPDRENLPDSIIVMTSDGRLLVRSAAVLHILARLGGLWRLISLLCRIMPAAPRDRLYDLIARLRHRIFRQPAAACPVLPAELRSRFDA